MKISVIIPSLCRGGAERAVSILSKEWGENHTIKIVVFDSKDIAYTYHGELIDLSLSAKSGVFYKAYNWLARIVKLSVYIQRENPDLIISFMESANFPMIVSAALTGKLKKLIVSVRAVPAHFPWLYRIFIRYLYRLPVRVVAVSQGVADELERIKIPSNKIQFIPNSIPCDQLTFDKPKEAKPCYILGVGRLHPEKGFDRLIQAFSGVDNPDIHLAILGEGDIRLELEKQAKNLGVYERLQLPGSVSNPMPWYQHAVCFVLSSRHEGWPNVMMEALSNGCPVIAFNCNYGPAEIIEDGVSGLLVPEGDIDELRYAIDRIIADKSLRQSLIENGLKRTEDFEVQKIAQYWLLEE